jgi:hypothetical protein
MEDVMKAFAFTIGKEETLLANAIRKRIIIVSLEEETFLK